MEDKTLTCKDCRADFVFSVRDQEFYAEKGFENEPQRCRTCRTQRKTTRSRSRSTREAFETTCARCSVATTVPFKPRGDRPVYCRECYAAVAPGPDFASVPTTAR
ncbi:MAG: zinc-ribbon domain containing protein [Vulcanimicrobiaceae bacterium]